MVDTFPEEYTIIFSCYDLYHIFKNQLEPYSNVDIQFLDIETYIMNDVMSILEDHRYNLLPSLLETIDELLLPSDIKSNFIRIYNSTLTLVTTNILLYLREKIVVDFKRLINYGIQANMVKYNYNKGENNNEQIISQC